MEAYTQPCCAPEVSRSALIVTDINWKTAADFCLCRLLAVKKGAEWCNKKVRKEGRLPAYWFTNGGGLQAGGMTPLKAHVYVSPVQMSVIYNNVRENWRNVVGAKKHSEVIKHRRNDRCHPNALLCPAT